MIQTVLVCAMCLAVEPPSGVEVRTADGVVRSDFVGGVPAGEAVAEAISLTLEDAVEGGL